MKNLKELQPILTAVYCINRTNGQEDEDIRNLIDYVSVIYGFTRNTRRRNTS